MPKMKSHTSTGKRVKITGSGKIMRTKGGKAHHMEHKSSKATRRMSGTTEVAPSDAKKIKKLLGR